MHRTILLIFTAVAIALVTAVGASRAEPSRSVGPDIAPELPADVYAKRRERLMKKLGGCVAAIKSVAPEGGYGNEFDSDFYYLTGVEEAGAVLMLAPRAPIYRETLLLRPRDAEAEIWEGFREPLSAALRDKYKVDRVSRMRGDAPRGLRRAMRHSRCYAELRAAFEDKPAVPAPTLGKYLKAFDARSQQKWQELERMRAIHDTEEIVRMDKAIAITFEGHRAAVKRLAAGVTERQIKGDIEGGFYDAGATGLAFPSIVGSGPNGAVLHWRSDDRAMTEGDLVVIDIGAAFGGYAADISRTWPVSGVFTDEQKKVYEAVLVAQQKVIDAIKPGISLDELHLVGERAIVAAGYELPHSIGHFVGLDVHDVGDGSAPLEAGMVITVEPGIYLPGKFGVRIEDMVLVTERGHRLMSKDLPRSIADVEAYVREQRK